MLDPDGQAREALASAIANFGPGILSNPQMLENIFRDLLPDSPREVSILVAAAQVDVAAMLQDRIGQHMDPDTAVRLSSSALGERRGLDGVACLWATNEFARALGHPVSEVAPPAPPEPDTGRVGADSGWQPESEVLRDDAPPPPPPPPPGGGTSPPPGGGMRPPAGSVPDDQTVTQGPGSPGSAGFPPPGSESGEPPPPGAGRRKLVLPGALALVVLIAVLVVVLTGHHGLKPGPTTTTTHPPSSSTTTPSSSVTTTTGTVIPPTQSLYDLVPGDDQDPTTCSPFENVTSAEAATVKLGLRCSDPDLSDYVYGLQFDNPADYVAGVNEFNSFYGFDADTAATSCPPSSGSQGIESYGFSDDNLPAITGQVLECFEDLGGYFYMWTLPSQNAILWTFNTDSSDIESWWSGGDPDPQF